MIDLKCKNCGITKTTKEKRTKFCSRSCSTSYNNRHYKRPQSTRREYLCKICKKRIDHRGTLCNEHNPAIVDWGSICIKDLIKVRKYQAHSRIRDLARRIYRKSDKRQECCKCGYSLRVDICHIKAISSFNLKTKISVINSIDNLIALCPNHHWEFDNNILELEP